MWARRLAGNNFFLISIFQLNLLRYFNHGMYNLPGIIWSGGDRVNGVSSYDGVSNYVWAGLSGCYFGLASGVVLVVSFRLLSRWNVVRAAVLPATALMWCSCVVVASAKEIVVKYFQRNGKQLSGRERAVLTVVFAALMAVTSPILSKTLLSVPVTYFESSMFAFFALLLASVFSFRLGNGG